jgi:hypothetical protein
MYEYQVSWPPNPWLPAPVPTVGGAGSRGGEGFVVRLRRELSRTLSRTDGAGFYHFFVNL